MKIADRNTRNTVQNIDRIVRKNESKTFEIFEKEITYNDIGKLEEGVRYLSKKNDGSVEMIMKISNDLYFLPLTKKNR